MTIREFYTLVGGSYDDMSERFPSDALILRFLTMLPQDWSMELLVRSMDAADAKTAFRAVHTLKGVAQSGLDRARGRLLRDDRGAARQRYAARLRARALRGRAARI